MAKKTAVSKPFKADTADDVRRPASGRRPFPAASLEDALKVAYAIKEKNGGNPWTPNDIASAINVGASTNRFYYITAAARDFGLTEGSNKTETIALTPFGREAVYALSSDEENRKRLEAFKKIDLYGKVLSFYSGSKVPEMKYLSNTLEREFGLDAASHEEFAQLFQADCDFLQIIDVPSSNGEPGSSARSVIVGESKTGGSLVVAQLRIAEFCGICE